MRPDQSWTTSFATRDMERELVRLSSHAVVVWLDRDCPDISLDRLERAFCSLFGVRPVDITVSRSPPADFLVTFTHRHHRDAAIAARDFSLGNLDFRNRLWQLITLGERHDLNFHVRLCLKGIPPHAWNESIAKRAVARACVLDYVEDDCLSSTKKDARCLNLWAWTDNPSDIPKVVWLTITSSVMVIHEGAPPPVGHCGLNFRVPIHLDLVEGPSGCDGLPTTRSLTWRHGVVDEEHEPRDRHDPPPTDLCNDRRCWDRDDEDEGDERCGCRQHKGESWSSRLFRSLPVCREARTVLIRGASNTATEDPGMEDGTATLDSVLRPSLCRRGMCRAVAENGIHIATKGIAIAPPPAHFASSRRSPR
jgi:hypothetical protein